MSEWKVQPSLLALKSSNPIVDYLAFLKDHGKPSFAGETIDLSSCNLCRAPEEVIDSFVQTVLEGKHNGYAPSVGFENTRNAILSYLNHPDLTPKDVILSSGVTSCLDIAFTALADRGQNILIAKPANPHYKLLAHGLGIETKEYELVPGTWEVNLADLAQKIDPGTAAILINNPNNPTGALYTETHLQSIFELANRHRLPLIFDESYRDLIFPGSEFISAIDINTKVPLLVCGGLGKSFMVPGWRIGWILIHDPVNAFEDVRKALTSLSQRIIGCNTVVQGAINSMMGTNTDFQRQFMMSVQKHSELVTQELKDTGIEFNPGRSVYAFLKVDLTRFELFNSSEQFCTKLYEEMGLVVLPGELFGLPGYFRISLDVESSKINDALQRIKKFASQYANSIDI